MQRFRSWCVCLYYFPHVLPPFWKCCAFPFRQVIVRRDVEGVRPQLRRGPFPAIGARRGSAFGWLGNERVCQAEVQNPYPILLRFVRVETIGPLPEHRCLGAQERLELPPIDSGGTMRQGGNSKNSVWVEAQEVPPR